MPDFRTACSVRSVRSRRIPRDPFTRSLRLSALALAAATSCAAWSQTAPAPASAAAPAAPTANADGSPGTLDRIVITARKRAEASQSVPLSVSAFNAEMLERSKIAGAQDLQFSIPNAVLTGNDRFTIRGIGNNSLGGDNGIGLAVNGAVTGFTVQDELFDIERVEVLRGPQGTLFGRNTTGGAIAVYTKRPTSVFGGNVSLELGNYEHKRIGGVLNIPFSDTLRQRFAGYVLKRDGFTRNETTGNNVDGRDQWSLRSSTQLTVGDNTEFNLVLASFKEDSTRTRETKRQCKAIAVLGCSPNELGFDSPDYTATVFRSLAASGVLGPVFPAGGNIYTGAANPADLRTVAADVDARTRINSDSATLEISHQFNPFTLTYTAGGTHADAQQSTDWDNATLAFRFTQPVTYSRAEGDVVTTDRLFTTDNFVAYSKTWTHELKIASRGKGPLGYTTGLFQLDSRGGGGFFIYHPIFEIFQRNLGRPAETQFINTETRGSVTKAWAWFGEGQWRIANGLNATLGARYTEEKRTGEGRSIVLSGPQPFTSRQPIDDDAWTGRASVDWAPAPDTLVYGSVATGYKGGGFNTGSGSNPTFEPEEVTAYELGVKRDWFDRTFRTNAAVFYNDYKNMQIGQRISAAAITANTNAVTKGFELEMAWVPNAALLFDANLSLLRTRIGDFLTEDAANPAQSLTVTTPPVKVSLTGNQLPHSPERKVKVGAQYSLPLLGTGWKMTARVDYVWQDKYFAREFNTPTDRIAAWSVTNLQLRLASPKNDIEIKAFVKNVTDNDNITNIIIEDPLVGRYRNVRLLDPRTFGVQVQYNF